MPLKRFLAALGLSLGLCGALHGAPSGPPAGLFITNVSTNAAKQTFNVSSGTVSTQLNLPYLTAGQCFTTNAAGNVIGTPCGGGSASLAVTTGSASGFLSVTSSPTAVINFDSSTFNTKLTGASTNFVTLSQSYLTTSSATATYLQNSSATATYLQLSSASATYLQSSSATATYFNKLGILPVANGGTGTSSPGLVAGTNIASITGTWPNQTINGNSTLVNSTGSVVVGDVAVFSSANQIIDGGTGGGDFIQNTNVLQAGSTFYTSSGTVATQFLVGGNTSAAMKVYPVTVSPTGIDWEFDISPSPQTAPFLNLFETNTSLNQSPKGFLFEDGSNIWGFYVDPRAATGQVNSRVNVNFSSTTNLTGGLNVSNFANVTSSATVSGAGGLGVTYGVSAGSMTFTGLGNTQIVEPNGLSGQIILDTATSNPTVGHLMVWGSSVTAIDGGSTSGPGGSPTQFQYNNNGVLAGTPFAIIQSTGISISTATVYYGTTLFISSSMAVTVQSSSTFNALVNITSNVWINGSGSTATQASSQFQVIGSTTNAYSALIGTSAVSATFHVAVSTTGHFITNGPVPTVSACGSTPSGSVTGDDNEGIITMGGTAPTACTLTFASPWVGTPVCTITDNSVTINGDISSTTSTQMVLGFGVGGLAGGTVYYRCGCSGSSCR